MAVRVASLATVRKLNTVSPVNEEFESGNDEKRLYGLRERGRGRGRGDWEGIGVGEWGSESGGMGGYDHMVTP